MLIDSGYLDDIGEARRRRLLVCAVSRLANLVLKRMLPVVMQKHVRLCYVLVIESKKYVKSQTCDIAKGWLCACLVVNAT